MIDKTSHHTLPKHIAIIMDGNGRWAASRGLPRIVGHRSGVRSVRTVVRKCSELGVKVLTLYAFSIENWNRPASEIDRLMEYLMEFLIKERKEMNQNQIRFMAIGRLQGLPEAVQQELKKTTESTAANKGMVLNLALNYGGRSEIIDAVRHLAQDVQEGQLKPSEVDERCFQNYLYTSDLPDPDLLIRTSGEQRLSNFLLWQISYTELYMTDVCWPDFGEKALLKAIESFQKRERRFGGVGTSCQ
jgi:undecaprenyl diphosphate synthase